jgi:nucleoside-diphosphate-sugar epimerase
MNYTIFGGRGFIGHYLAAWLESQGLSCWAPERGENWAGRHLGHLIYCIGVTSDFRSRPFDTVRAHVCHLLEILEKAEFESFLYLSSTRVYGVQDSSCEDTPLRTDPANREDFYNISKVMGEALCLNSNRRNVRIARLSTVYPPDFSAGGFLSSILTDALDRNRIVLRRSLDSTTDYIDMDTVVRLLQRIACSGTHSIYNIASGTNTSDKDVVTVIQRMTGCSVEIQALAPTVSHPIMVTQRIQQEFGQSSFQVLNALPGLVSEYQRRKEGSAT